MNVTTCPDQESLRLLLSGSLRGPKADQMEAHLLHCDVCSAVADSISAHDDLTTSIQSVETGDDNDERLAQAIAQVKQLRSTAETQTAEETLVVNDLGAQSAASKQIAPADIDFLAPPGQPDEIGRLGGYRVLEVLGVGGMGVVFRAQDPKLKRQVALKAMKPAIAVMASAKDRFLKEAQATALIEHDHIVTIHQVGEDRGVPFIAMRFLQGESLQTKLNPEGKLDQRQAARIGREVASGLAAAHAHGLIHRDIKPDNIWLESKPPLPPRDGHLQSRRLLKRGEGPPSADTPTSPRAKIVDFGLVRSTQADAGLTQSGVVVGTPKYMAPEQAAGELVDHRCDLFSLGSVLYHLVTGKAPFAGRNLTAVLMAVAGANPTPVQELCPDLHPDFADLITRLLSKDREDRPADANEVVRILSDIEQKLNEPLVLEETVELPHSPTPPHPHPASLPPRNRQRTLLAFAGLAAVLLGAIIKITGPDGKTTKVKVPRGSDVGIDGEGNVSVALPKVVRASQQTIGAGWHGWPADAPPPAIAPFTAEQAQQHQEAWAKHLEIPVGYENSIGMKFRLIPPGEFLMGTTPEEVNIILATADQLNTTQWKPYMKSQSPQHRVILTQPIYLSSTEVTQFQFKQVMKYNPSFFSANGGGNEAIAGNDADKHPVESVSWNEAAEFCAKLSQNEGREPFYLRNGETVKSLEGSGYRLPTEAEWEFACRAGTNTRFWTGNDDTELISADWIGINSEGRTHAVGELKSNPFGLFDMHGNVWEWCGDVWSDAYYSNFISSSAVNPKGPSIIDPLRAGRGGIWHYPAVYCWSSNRFARETTFRLHGIGFRVALVVDGVRKAGAGSRGVAPGL